MARLATKHAVREAESGLLIEPLRPIHLEAVSPRCLSLADRPDQVTADSP